MGRLSSRFALTMALGGLILLAGRHLYSSSVSQSAVGASDPFPVAGESTCETPFHLTHLLQHPPPYSDLALPCGQPAAISDPALRQCLRRRLAAYDRPVRVAFVGDSRSRYLFSALAEATNASEPPLPTPDPQMSYPPRLLQTVTMPPELWCRFGASFCSRRALGQLAELQTRWRPFMAEPFSAALAELADRCEAGDCADLVVANSGMWYTHRVTQMRSLSQEHLVLLYREQLREVAAPLVRLARRLPTVWKLEEATFSDKASDTKVVPIPVKVRPVRQMLVMKAVAQEQMARIPRVTVWSSLSTLATHAVLSTCATPDIPPEEKTWADIPSECAAEDAAHMKPTYQRCLLAPLLRQLCRGW